MRSTARLPLALVCLLVVLGLSLPLAAVGAQPAAEPAPEPIPEPIPGLVTSPTAAESIADETAAGLRDDLRQVIGAARDRVFPALVSIRVVVVRYAQGKEWKGQSVGSGTIVSPEGHVVTNFHVVDHGEKFFVTLSDKQEVSAKLVGEDPLTDVAVLQLDLSELRDPKQPLPVATFGDSSHLQIGDYVMAMGSPFSLSRSVSLGIVSNTERVFAGGFGDDELDEMELQDGQRSGLFTRWIQHDALILPGNSGGPLVDLGGRVVGVNQLGVGPMGFAIPSTLAQRVAEELIAHGEVRRSWLGLSFKPIARTGLDEGVLISSAVVDGPGHRAGVRAGDVLMAIDGEPLTVRFVEEVPPLQARLADVPAGESVSLTVARDGERHTFDAVAEPLERDLGDEASFHAWGITAQQLTSKMARDRRLASTAGALVTGVRSGSPAQLAEPAIVEGDVILAVGDREVADLEALVERYGQVTGDDAEPVLFEIDRQGKNHVTLVEPRDGDAVDPPRELPKAWIGVATQPLLPELAARLALGDAERGFRVTRVYPRTEAAGSTLAVGDVIVSVDGEPVEPSSMQDSGLLARRVRGMAIGEPVVLGVVRDGERLDVPVTLERTRITPEEARRYNDTDFELAVREVTFFDRDEARWDDDVEGVLVERVEPGGWAGLGGLRPGDLVLRIAGHEVGGLSDFREAMESLDETQPERVEVVVLRGVKTYFQYLEPDWAPTVTPEE